MPVEWGKTFRFVCLMGDGRWHWVLHRETSKSFSNERTAAKAGRDDSSANNPLAIRPSVRPSIPAPSFSVPFRYFDAGVIREVACSLVRSPSQGLSAEEDQAMRDAVADRLRKSAVVKQHKVHFHYGRLGFFAASVPTKNACARQVTKFHFSPEATISRKPQFRKLARRRQTFVRVKVREGGCLRSKYKHVVLQVQKKAGL